MDFFFDGIYVFVFEVDIGKNWLGIEMIGFFVVFDGDEMGFGNYGVDFFDFVDGVIEFFLF